MCENECVRKLFLAFSVWEWVWLSAVYVRGLWVGVAAITTIAWAAKRAKTVWECEWETNSSKNHSKNPYVPEFSQKGDHWYNSTILKHLLQETLSSLLTTKQCHPIAAWN